MGGSPVDYRVQHLALPVQGCHLLRGNMAKKRKDDVQSAVNCGMKAMCLACAIANCRARQSGPSTFSRWGLFYYHLLKCLRKLIQTRMTRPIQISALPLKLQPNT